MAPADNDHAWEITSRWEDILEWCKSFCFLEILLHPSLHRPPFSSVYFEAHKMVNTGSMLPPNSPASASNSNARARQIVSAPSSPLTRSQVLSTCWQTVITTATQSGAFSETVKSQLRAIYDQERPCWVCQETDADCAHVFAKEDSQVCDSLMMLFSMSSMARTSSYRQIYGQR